MKTRIIFRKEEALMKRVVVMGTFITILVFATVPFALGQALDQTWFELKINIKGHTVDRGTGVISPATFNTIAYLRLTSATSCYDALVYTEVTPGDWQPADYGLCTEGTNEEIGTIGIMPIAVGSNRFTLHHALSIKIRKDDAGTLRSAAMKSMGCDVISGYMSSKPFYGGCTVKGKRVDAPPFFGSP